MDPTLKYILTSAAWVVGVLFIASTGYFFARLGKSRDRKTDAEQKEVDDIAEESAKRGQRITELESAMAVLKAEAVPIQAAFQAMLIAKLTHFHTPVIDELMKKMGPPSTLTARESKKLASAMQKRKIEVDSKIDEEERLAAGMLIDAHKLNEIEFSRQTKAKTETVLVTQPATEVTPKGDTEEKEK